jgi:hypothetical protein
MGKYSNALTQFEEGFQIVKRYLPTNHLIFADRHLCFAMVQSLLGHYGLALSNLEKALKILHQSSLDPQATDVVIFNNIGTVSSYDG